MEENSENIKQKRPQGVEAVFQEVDRIVNPRIEELLDRYIEEDLRKVVKYQISTGGKKLRSSLAVLSCLGCGGSISEVGYPAAALEILHNSTLIVDDIIDHSDTRRNKPTAWKKYGTSVSQCLTFMYSASVFQSILSSGQDPYILVDRFAAAFKGVLQGEIKDVLLEASGREQEDYVRRYRYGKVKVEDYLAMASQKTALLLQTSCEIGGLCAFASDKELKCLRDYGYYLGLSFQIRDDILDILGKEEEFGKRIGKDIHEGKLGNILVIYALEELQGGEERRLRKILSKKDINESEAEEAIELIRGTEAEARASELATGFIQKGEEGLNRLSGNEYMDILRDILEFVAKRNI